MTLSGNLEARAKRYGQVLDGFSQRGQRGMAMLQRSVHAVGAGLDRLGNRYTALLSGAAGVGAAKMVMDLEMRFTRLGIQANASADEVARLKKEIYGAAQAPDVRIDPGEITSAIEAITEKTGDLKFAQENMRNIGLAIQATGAAGQDIGEILAEFQKMDIKSPDKVLEALDVLNVQGKEGAFTLQNLAALGPRVVTAYTAMGRGGVDALREMGAVLQVIRMGTGDSANAATSFEAMLRSLSDMDKVKVLQQGGIKVFDEEELKKGRKVLRPINELMLDIIRKTKGDKGLIQKLLGDSEAARAFNAAVAEFNRTGAVSSLEKFMGVHADGMTTTKDSARAAKTASAALTNLYTAWKKFADSELTGPIQSLADMLNSLEPATVERWMKVAKWVAIIGGGAIVARKVGNAIGSLRGGGAGGAAGAAGGLGGMPLPLPVYVVNKHMSLSPDAWGGGPGGGKGSTKGKAAAAKGALARAGNVLKTGAVAAAPYAAPAAAILGAGAVGYGIGTLAYKGMEGTSAADAIGRSVAQVLALFGNDEAKAALATERAAEKKMKGELHIRIDQEGRAKVRQLRGSNLDMDVSSGLTMVGN